MGLKQVSIVRSDNYHFLICNFLFFSPDCVRVRGAGGPRAGCHRHREVGRIPHLRRLLSVLQQLQPQQQQSQQQL